MQWFRLYSEFATDAKLASFNKAEKFDIIHLFCLANQSSERGLIQLEPEDLAAALSMDLPAYEAFIDRLEKRRIVERTPDGLNVTQWVKRQYDNPSDAPDKVAQRVARHRQRRRNEVCNDNVTSCNDAYSDTDTENNNKSLSACVREDEPQSEPAANGLKPLEELGRKFYKPLVDYVADGKAIDISDCSQQQRHALHALCRRFARDNLSLADLERYQANFRAMRGRGRDPTTVTPPTAKQMLENFDQVMNYQEPKNGTKQFPTNDRTARAFGISGQPARVDSA